MTIQEIQKKLLTDEDFVVSEIRKIQELYKLKNEIRWAQSRQDKNLTESVAEHVYGMHIVADYFLPLENPEQTWDSAKIHQMITWHDIEEVEVGDIISLNKTEAQVNNERGAAQLVIERMPTHMQTKVEQTLDEYFAQETPEAKFVKALDKAEPIFEIYQEGFDQVLKSIGRKSDHWDKIITQRVALFPYMKRFAEVVHQRATAEGFFAQ